MLHDLKGGVRRLRREPGSHGVLVLILGLGIGASSSIFSLVDAFLLRPLPYDAPEALVYLTGTSAAGPVPDAAPAVRSVPYRSFLDWREQSTSFQALAAKTFRVYNLTGTGTPERVEAQLVTANLFELLGVEPQLGRGFLPADDRADAAPVAVLAHGIWQRRFAGDPGIVGRTVLLDGTAFTVAGVMPRSFRFPPWGFWNIDVWVPIGLYENTAQMRHRGLYTGMVVVGRLRPGVSLDAARADMDVVARRLEQQYPDTDAGRGVRVDVLREAGFRSLRPMLLALAGAVAFVVLIACANLTNLLLARSAARRQEMAIRASLGAGRRRLVRQLLTELAVIGALGCGAGLLLALWLVSLIPAMLPGDVEGLREFIRLDGRVLLFTAAASLAMLAAAGLLPALRQSGVDPGRGLRDGSSTTAGPARLWPRNALVVFEIALTLVLLIGAGLMIRSLWLLARQDLGFNPRGVLVADLSIPDNRYPGPERIIAFFGALLERARALPGVQDAAVATPLLGGWSDSFQVEGRPPPPRGQEPRLDNTMVTPGYFRVMEIPLLRGRTFTEGDTLASRPVAVIDETLARRFFPGQDPIGRRLHIGSAAAADRPRWIEIVGIVGHVRHHGAGAESNVQIYLPFYQSARASAPVLLRADVDPLTLAAPLQRHVLELDRDQPLSAVYTMQGYVAGWTARQRTARTLLVAFAAAGLVLAALGIYGVVAFSVSRRTREIGIRMALGARRGQVLRMVLGQGLRLTLYGIALGTLASVAVLRALSSLLFEVRTTDPFTVLPAILLLALVAVLSVWFPAHAAARLHPTAALRRE